MQRLTRLGIGPGLFASERPFRILEGLGRREGFPVVKLLPIIRERDPAEGPLFWADDIHHTPQGARVFAEGLLPGPWTAKFCLDVGGGRAYNH